jgi:hypothetical protein
MQQWVPGGQQTPGAQTSPQQFPLTQFAPGGHPLPQWPQFELSV